MLNRDLKKELKLEFINYLATPDDPYMLGIAGIKLLGLIELRYKHIRKKDGSGTFFAAASYSLQENSQKTFIASFKFDTEINNFIVEEIRKNVEGAMRPQSVYTPDIGEAVYAKPDDNLPF